jgi:glycosyltransferase involved in cell wall biosynthesis
VRSPQLSVITITYQDPVGLRKTIESLRALDADSSWEHVIVDSSPDVNAPIVNSLRETNWPLRYVRAPAEGIYAAFNVGLKNATGQYLWFLNGGDLIADAGALQRSVEAFRHDASIDFVVSAAELRLDGTFFFVSRPSRRLPLNLVGNQRICHQAVIYRRRLIERVGDYSTKYKFAGDYEFHLRCLIANGRYFVLPQNVLAVYDVGGRSWTQLPGVFEDCRLIHLDLRKRLPVWMSIGNELVRPLEYRRLLLMDLASKSQIGPIFTRAWLALRRRF